MSETKNCAFCQGKYPINEIRYYYEPNQEQIDLKQRLSKLSESLYNEEECQKPNRNKIKKLKYDWFQLDEKYRSIIDQQKKENICWFCSVKRGISWH